MNLNLNLNLKNASSRLVRVLKALVVNLSNECIVLGSYTYLIQVKADLTFSRGKTNIIDVKQKYRTSHGKREPVYNSSTLFAF